VIRLSDFSEEELRAAGIDGAAVSLAGAFRTARNAAEPAKPETEPAPTVEPTPMRTDLARYVEAQQHLPAVTSMPIISIRRDGGTQARLGADTDTVEDYTEAMRAGAVFPSVVVFKDEAGACWLADGFHRVEAADRCGHKEILVTVLRGSLRDAILYAVGPANADHGLRRTNEDKRRCVTRLLKDDEWSKWSDRQIAKHCRVSDRFVNGLRGSITANVRSGESAPAEQTRTYRNRHGGLSRMRTGNIGKARTKANEEASPTEPTYETNEHGVQMPVGHAERVEELHGPVEPPITEIPPLESDGGDELLRAFDNRPTKDEWEKVYRALKDVFSILFEESQSLSKPPRKDERGAKRLFEGHHKCGLAMQAIERELAYARTQEDE
jgi:hypothetical protein